MLIAVFRRRRSDLTPSGARSKKIARQGVVGVEEGTAMNELKIAVDDRDAFEERLRRLGGIMEEPHWIGNWYLESRPKRVLKVVQANGVYRLLELRKLDAGFAFVSENTIADIGLYRLDHSPPENVLHKTVRPWDVEGQSVDVLVFDDIGVYACVNYEDGAREKALAFIASLAFPELCYVEVPFNVLKRRQMGLPDFHEPA